MADQIPEWLKKLSDPSEWRERIEYAANHNKRKEWLNQVELAKKFVNNEFDPEIQTVENIYWYKSASYIRIRNYLLGRLAFGEMKPKVVGVELPDENLAWMYEKAIDWEFNRPRGGNRTIGRKQIPLCLMNWVDFGLGDINTYFDPFRVDKENWTGSIIIESVDPVGVILDPDARNIHEIRYLGRKFDVSEEEFRGIMPAYDGDIPLNDKNRTTLFEVQFRTDRPVEVRFNSKESSEYIYDSRPYWRSENEFKNAYMAGLKKRKELDKGFKPPYHPNKEAQKLWDSFKRQYISLPMTYGLFFCGTEEKPAVLVHGPIFVGDDYSHNLIPLIEIYDTPYPVGAPYYVADMQKLEIILKTLYVRMMLRANNSNTVVDVNRIDGPNALKTYNDFKANIGAMLPMNLRGVTNIDQVFRQLDVKPPHQVMLDLSKYIRWEIDEFFNTHEAMTGMPPFAGASGELTKVLQATGSYPLGTLVNNIQSLMDNIFRKIAKLIYRYMPYEKRILVSDAPDQTEMVTLKKELMSKIDPNDFDISVRLDTTSESEKIRKEQTAIAAFQLGLYDPLTTLEEMGKKREAKMILERNQDYKTGQQMVEMMKSDKDFASQVDAYIRMKTLEAEGE